MRCQDCKWFSVGDSNGEYLGTANWGECRRFPPQVIPGDSREAPFQIRTIREYKDGAGVLGRWPEVDPDEWCGEYQPAP